jgi:hypothetical protein
MKNAAGGLFRDYRVVVIPKARVFTSAPRDLPQVRSGEIPLSA